MTIDFEKIDETDQYYERANWGWWVSSQIDKDVRSSVCEKIKHHIPNVMICEDLPEHGSFGHPTRNNFTFIWLKFLDDTDEAQFIILANSGAFDQ